MESMNLFGKNSEERNDGLVHYQGELGDFWYDPNEFEVLTHERAKFWYDPKESVLTAHEKVEFEYLHYVGNNGAVDLPKGCINTRYMFWDCELPEGFQLIAFNTSNVEVMEHMFYRCRIPTGFSLGDEFSTSNVIDMSWMFAGCKISTGFTLGHKFDTSKVRTMEGMFYGCGFPEKFTLGDNFNTINVEAMDYMFCGCKFPHDFSFGNNFNTENTGSFRGMFASCVFPEGFSLGNKFSIANGYLQPYPDDPKLAYHIIVTAEGMFAYSTILGDFDLGESFKAEFFTIKRKDMFSNCILPAGAKQSQFHTDSAIIKWLKARHLDKINQKQDQ